ncbi:CoA ester lyase [Kaistia algarum]|nr:CoA ester lyase [Kaistia algarum]
MRSKLFVPGSRPELFEKAWRSPADAISFDLEDAVVGEKKAEARERVGAELRARGARRTQTVIVRVNPVGGRLFESDLDAVVQPGLHMINLPKIEDVGAVRDAAARLDRLERERGIDLPIGILVNIETPKGLRMTAELAGASDRVAGLQLGFGDLFEPLGIARTPAALHQVRLAARLAAGEAGVPVYDGAFVGVADPAGYQAEAEAARALGFAGKSCIHPSQVAIANAVFAPTAAEVERARRIVAVADEMEAKGVGAFMVDGDMADGPFIARAREIVRMAERAELDV